MESNSLDKIINLKKEKLNSLKNELNTNDLKSKIDKFDKFFDFKKSIEKNFSQGKISLIAEIKKASPSAGVLVNDFDHLNIAKMYVDNGATCLSVLTEEKHFLGKLDYIQDIKKQFKIPVLAKDFFYRSLSNRFIKKLWLRLCFVNNCST